MIFSTSLNVLCCVMLNENDLELSMSEDDLMRGKVQNPQLFWVNLFVEVTAGKDAIKTRFLKG
jgi:hypothetical protein